MKLRIKRERSTPRLDPTPMVDIVFNLLLFFMLSSSFVMYPGMKVNLPKTSISEVQTEKRVILTITKEEKFFLNDKPVPRDRLEGEFRLHFFEGQKILIIRADAQVPHGTVVQVMDLAKLAGAEKLAIATEPKKIK